MRSSFGVQADINRDISRVYVGNLRATPSPVVTPCSHNDKTIAFAEDASPNPTQFHALYMQRSSGLKSDPPPSDLP